MKIPVIVNGAAGKMGVLAVQTLQENPQYVLVATLGRQDNLAQTILNTGAQIVIDLTRADCVYQNTLTIIDCGARPVIGTSGLRTAEIETLTARCEEKQLGGVIVPNFSIAAVLLMHFAAKAARHFNAVEIIEAHHAEKHDAPSGTAMKTADMIATHFSLPEKPNAHTNALPGARGASHHGIPIHSIRLPGILAHQEVIFGGRGETLHLTHNTIDRSCYMPGLLLACQQVMTLTSLHYGLETVLSLGDTP